jgi:hypothetical protein
MIKEIRVSKPRVKFKPSQGERAFVIPNNVNHNLFVVKNAGFNILVLKDCEEFKLNKGVKQ